MAKPSVTSIDTVAGTFRLHPVPDVEMARSRFNELYEVLDARGRRFLQNSRILVPALLHGLGLSPFIHQGLMRHPSFILRLTDTHLVRPFGKHLIERDLATHLSGRENPEEFSSFIRTFRLYHTLRIALRELSGCATVRGTMIEMSNLADVVVSACLRFAWMLLARRHGQPGLIKNGRRVRSHFSVIDLGKLGGKELNFSSDIDILYLYDSEKGETEGAPAGRPLPNAEFYRRLSETLTRLISEKTPDGFGFRVDLGLRPDGQYGDIASSLRSMEVYYEAWGKLWERAVWIKARHGAGHAPLTRTLLKTLYPFVYRKYLDFTAIEEIRELKLKIDQENRLRRKGRDDIKLGRGGIREIEFFVQALQLIHGGKVPRLRCHGTLQALQRLRETRLVPDDEIRSLTKAYLFLRRLEHRIQLIHQRQTQSLPAQRDDQIRVARSLGFDDAETGSLQAFNATLTTFRETVHEIYENLFYAPSNRSVQGVSGDVQALFTENVPSHIAQAWLAENGFRSPEKALNTLRRLREGPPSAHYVPKTLSRLNRLLPSLLQSVISSPDPDMALGYLLSFVEKIGARGTFYALLLENPPVLKLLAKVFGSSRFLSSHLIYHPELLDELIHPAHVTILKSANQMRKELNALLQDRTGDLEAEMDGLRKFKHAEVLRIGIQDIYGDMDIQSVTQQLSQVAEVCLKAAYRIALKTQTGRYALPPTLTPPFIILGMGKLGGRELNYSSDLDLIFLFDDTANGGLPVSVDPNEFYGKLAQRFITVMTSQTVEGSLYEIDTRLRPSGTFGPIVTSLRSFTAYHRHSAWLWERQALIKARPIAGSPRLSPQVKRRVNEIVYGKPITEKEKEEILSLRYQMETEIGRETPARLHIKCGRGGLVDIEFLIQYYQIKYGGMYPGVRQPNTLRALAALKKRGILSGESARELRENYLFLRKLETRLQILENRSVPFFNPKGPEMVQLARRMGYRMQKGGTAPKKLYEDYIRKTTRNRMYFQKLLETLPQSC